MAAGILVYEHRLVRPGDLSRLDAAFFTMNGVMSVTVFAFALLDRMLGEQRVTPAIPVVARAHRRVGRAVRRAAARGPGPARVPVWLIPSSHGMRLLRESAGSISLDALRAATGGDWISVTTFPDDDRGALPASGSQRTPAW